jgi:hypothetical protein
MKIQVINPMRTTALIQHRIDRLHQKREIP